MTIDLWTNVDSGDACRPKGIDRYDPVGMRVLCAMCIGLSFALCFLLFAVCVCVTCVTCVTKERLYERGLGESQASACTVGQSQPWLLGHKTHRGQALFWTFRTHPARYVLVQGVHR